MAPKIHLPESVLGMNITLAEKQVMMSCCIDMRNSVAIPEDPRRTVQSGDLDLTFNYGK